MNYNFHRYVHTDTGFVFYSKDERVVFGKLNQAREKIIRLSDKDVETCKQHGFKVDVKKWTEYNNSL